METPDATPIELLKDILVHLHTPDALNNHPWAIRQNAATRQIPIPDKSAGEQLVDWVTDIFRTMMPPRPPRRGKRPDTRWGIFGILAALHFAPLLRGDPFPSSLEESWSRMDDSILFFVYGSHLPNETERAKYCFAAAEPEPAANSTLSNWYHSGVEQLAELVNAQQKRPNTSRRAVKWIGTTVSLVAFLAMAFFGWKFWRLYQHVRDIETRAHALESYLTLDPDLEKIPEIASEVHTLRTELDALQMEAEPYLWMAPYSAWIPKYGGTISQAEQLLALAQNLTTAADEGFEAVSPAVETALSNDQPPDVMELIRQLQAAGPQLLKVQLSLVQAQEARERIDADLLTPTIRNLLTNRIDPLFHSIADAFPMEDALALIRIAPDLLGAAKAGPQTYLLLLQNEDELRPTGGYLTAAGPVVVRDGKIISMKIESSELIDNFVKPYPIPPWQFEEFMNIEMLLFRDSNWFTDFPTTASWAEYFYSYSRAASTEGTIAMDMHVIVRLLETLGPIRVEGVNYFITDQNVLNYLRSAEEAPPQGVTGRWNRKQFINDLATPLLNKALEARGQTWTRLFPVLIELLDEKHIVLQFDNEEAAAFLERRNWDGSVRIPDHSDYLMVVDTNMGYNKSNAVMEVSLEYNVDFSLPASPKGSLLVRQTNHSAVILPCEPFSTERFLIDATQPGEMPDPYYNIDECHWGYLRLYTPEGTKLLHSNPHAVPAESTMLGEPIPARTDDLGSEDIPGAQVFGMMVITPTGQSTSTRFDYSLPSRVVTINKEDASWIYHLKVQKQPGTTATPFNLILQLPAGLTIENATIPFVEEDGVWKAQLDLRRDLWIEVLFSTVNTFFRGNYSFSFFPLTFTLPPSRTL